MYRISAILAIALQYHNHCDVKDGLVCQKFNFIIRLAKNCATAAPHLSKLRAAYKKKFIGI